MLDGPGRKMAQGGREGGREGEHQQVRVGAAANLRQPHNSESDQDEGSVLLSLHLGL